jgi:HK97 family phage major capsid protein
MPEIEQYIREGLTGAMSEAYDTAMLFTASANSPTPIAATAGVTSTAVGSDDVFTAIVKALGRMATNKVKLENVNVIMHPLVAVKTATTRAGSNGDFLATASAAGQPMVGGGGENMLGEMIQRRLGIPVFTTSLVPVASSTSSIFVVNGRGVVLGDRKTLEISSSNVAGDAFKKNLTYFKAILRGDVMLKRAADLEIITGVAH